MKQEQMKEELEERQSECDRLDERVRQLEKQNDSNISTFKNEQGDIRGMQAKLNEY